MICCLFSAFASDVMLLFSYFGFLLLNPSPKNPPLFTTPPPNTYYNFPRTTGPWQIITGRTRKNDLKRIVYYETQTNPIPRHAPKRQADGAHDTTTWPAPTTEKERGEA